MRLKQSLFLFTAVIISATASPAFAGFEWIPVENPSQISVQPAPMPSAQASMPPLTPMPALNNQNIAPSQGHLPPLVDTQALRQDMTMQPAPMRSPVFTNPQPAPVYVPPPQPVYQQQMELTYNQPRRSQYTRDDIGQILNYLERGRGQPRYAAPVRVNPNYNPMGTTPEPISPEIRSDEPYISVPALAQNTQPVQQTAPQPYRQVFAPSYQPQYAPMPAQPAQAYQQSPYGTPSRVMNFDLVSAQITQTMQSSRQRGLDNVVRYQPAPQAIQPIYNPPAPQTFYQAPAPQPQPVNNPAPAPQNMFEQPRQEVLIWQQPRTQMQQPVSRPIPQQAQPSMMMIDPFPLGTPQPQAVPMAAPVQPMPASRQYEMISGFGTDMPLAMALQQIIPQGYGYGYSNASFAGKRVSWDGGKPWPDVLNTMLAPHNLQASINGNRVVIKESGPVVTPRLIPAQTSYIASQPRINMAPRPSTPSAGPLNLGNNTANALRRRNVIDPGISGTTLNN